MTTKLIVSPPLVQREMGRHPQIIREVHTDVLRDLMRSDAPVEKSRRGVRGRTCV